MLSEYESDLFERWLETQDKEEYVTLGLQLFPEATREEFEYSFELARKDYSELTRDEREMLRKAGIDARKHFEKLRDEPAKERQYR